MSDKYKIRYLPIAVQDLEDILDYIQTDNPSAALNLIDTIDNSISKLSTHPYIGGIPKDSRLLRLGYRILIIKNYLAFYVVNESINEVEIRRVLLSRQKYEFLL